MHLNRWRVRKRIGECWIRTLEVLLAEGARCRGADLWEVPLHLVLRVVVRQYLRIVGLRLLVARELQGVFHEVVGVESPETFFPKRRGRCGPALHELALKEADQLVQLWPGLDILREEVGWIELSTDLSQLEVPLPQPLLNPECVTLYVPHLP